MEHRNVWCTYDLEQQKACLDFAEEYRHFLSDNKTERECVDTFVNEAEKAGYVELNRAIEENRHLQPGDKIYMAWMNKSLVMFQIGTEPMEHGLNILGAHIDSPRLDIKQNPVYEKGGFAYLDTHYYGGIKKYLFVAMPLALHGVIVKKDGETVVLNVGEDPDDPVFFISDLLIHLAKDQMTKPASKVVEGEALDLIVGSRPVTIDANTKALARRQAEAAAKTAAAPNSSADGDNAAAGCSEEADATAAETADKSRAYRGLAPEDGVKLTLLHILKETYGITEEDFESAELEVVPAGPARDAGFDRSMILGYGQDDRVCAYPSFRAMLANQNPKRTSVTLLVDKEEIGSVGATGMQSRFFENALAEVMNLAGQFSEIAMRRCLANSCMLSSDVSSAYDPLYEDRFDSKNTAYLGRGLVLNKYTGVGGKDDSNDANAEYIAHLRHVFDENNVVVQTSELGRVDAGGGGTIAYILALYGMNVIDSGVPVLSMHAPWEATSKADIYEAFRGYGAFLRDADFRNM